MKRKPAATKARWKRWIRRLVVGSFAVAAALGIAAFTLLAVWPPINDVSTGETAQYPDVQPIAYRFSQPRVVAAAVESIEALERFDIVATDEATGVVEATATTRSGRFVDDVTVRVEANGEGGAIVFMRSRSRVGVGDLGQNARNIRQLQAQMNRNLGDS